METDLLENVVLENTNFNYPSSDDEPKKPQIFKCEICFKEYKNRSGLWKHKKTCKENINLELKELDETLENQLNLDQNTQELLLPSIYSMIENLHNENKKIIQMNEELIKTNTTLNEQISILVKHQAILKILLD